MIWMHGELLEEIWRSGHDEFDLSLNRLHSIFAATKRLWSPEWPLRNRHLLVIQNDLIKGVHRAVLDDISRQIQEALCVALMSNETSIFR
jgi:hypothetical protein